MSTYRVYILCRADDSYYTGHTVNLEKRLAEHQVGEGGE
jgi:putative endonuclease